MTLGLVDCFVWCFQSSGSCLETALAVGMSIDTEFDIVFSARIRMEDWKYIAESDLESGARLARVLTGGVDGNVLKPDNE